MTVLQRNIALPAPRADAPRQRVSQPATRPPRRCSVGPHIPVQLDPIPVRSKGRRVGIRIGVTSDQVFQHVNMSQEYPAPFCTVEGEIRSALAADPAYELWALTAEVAAGASIAWAGRDDSRAHWHAARRSPESAGRFDDHHPERWWWAGRASRGAIWVCPRFG